MAYNKVLADRIRKILAKKPGISEKAMFGGLSFLLSGRMFCGVLKDNLVLRVNPDESETLFNNPHVRPMDFTGRPMKGFIYVGAGGYESDKSLEKWVKASLDYVSLLPLSKKHKK